ncbi:MAG: ATP-binding protein [Bacteroidales bacterium]|nr:ATP-binding protein [Bacteroidales bacterium]
MNRLFETHIKKVERTDVGFVRNLMNEIDWNARLIGLKGARGVGKTTLLLQRCKLYHKLDGSSLYVSVDNIWFSEHKLYDFASDFAKKGGRYLFLDEVHKYPNWSQELKNIYDDFPELNIVFTGSSLLEIINAKADLSRRAVVYEMQGFSFREYLNMTLKLNLQSYSLYEILENHIMIAQNVLKEVKVLKYFEHYLKYGYYPYYNELPDLYYSRVNEVVNLIIETEIPLLRSVDIAYTRKIKQLLLIISESAPFVPNVSKLSERIGITRNALLSYLNALNESRLIISAHKSSGGISVLQKPDKIYLENPNLMYALSDSNVNMGNVRETFFANQLQYKYKINVSEHSDFYVDNQYTFEIGGKDKGKKQINAISDSYVVSDDIEYGFNEKIPLWLFGFLY